VTPDGDTVIAADYVSVLTWDAATGRLRTKVNGGGKWIVQALAPDGATFVARGPFGTVTLRSTLTGRQLARIDRRLWRLNEVAIAPDNSWLATLTSDRFVRIWDTTTGRRRSSLAGNLYSIHHLAVSPDSTRIATSHFGYGVKLWDAATGRPILRIPTPRQSITTMAITPDGSGLATGDTDGTVQIRDTATGEIRATGPRHEDWTDQIAVSGDGAWIATAGHDRTVRVWNLADAERKTVLPGHLDNVRVVALAPDGSWIVSGSDDATIRVWDNRTRTDRIATSSGTPVAAMALAANGACLVIARSDYGVRLLDPQTGRETAAISVKSPAVAAAPNGAWIAIADGSDVLLWDVGADQPRGRLHGHREAPEPGHPPVGPASIRGVAVSPDGAWIAIADDHVVTVHKVSTGLKRCHFVLSGRPQDLKFGPDGSWLATSGNGTIRTWDTRSGLQRTRVRCQARYPTAFTTTPDGDLLFIAGYEGVFATGVADKGISTELTGHPDQPSAMAVTQDGRWVAGCSASGAVWVWDFFRRGRVVAMTRVDDNLIACAWSPDGRYLYVGGSRGTYRFEFRDRPA
jgi:WD40 repeat protein